MARRLGQYFLSDPAILDRIVDALEPAPQDVVIEIGPGRGSLTRRLAPRVGQVIAIEKDRRLALALAGEQSAVSGELGPTAAGRVTVVAGDALKLDWAALTAHSSPLTARGWKVVGNIPYYITTPLIEKALSPLLPRVIVFLIQKEVADRLAAAPGSKTFGALSAGVQAVAQVERLFTVRKGAFRPPPKVDSAVVRLRPLAQPLVSAAEQPAWRRFLSGVFSQRRKQLARSLRALSGLSKEDVEALLKGLGVDPSVRPEMLGPHELVRVFREVAR